MNRHRGLKIVLIILVLVFLLPYLYILYDRSLVPPPPTWSSPAYTPGQTWEQYAQDFIKKQNKPNALEHYLIAFSAATTNFKHIDDISAILKRGWFQDFPEVDNILQLNQTTLDEIIKGAQIHNCEFPPQPYGEGAPIFRSFLKAQVLGKYIALAGRRLERDNRINDALDYYLDGVQFAQDMELKGTEISLLLGAMNIKNELVPIYSLLSTNKLNEKQYLNIIQDLNRIDRQQISFGKFLDESNRRSYAYSYYYLNHQNEYFKEYAQSVYHLSQTPGGYKSVFDEITFGGYMMFNYGRVLRNDTNFRKELVDAATTKTYQEFMQIDWDKKVPKDFAHRSSNAWYVLKQSFTRQMDMLSRLRLAEIQSAIQMYHLQKKKWSKSLEELKPDYLATIPLDPFTKKPFLWSQDSTGPFAYSVGPDFKDNSAKIVYDPTNGTVSSGDIRP